MSLCDDLNCPAVLAAIDEYLDNELTIEEHARVSAHLENCPKCVAHADLERTLKESVQRCCQDTAPDRLRQRVINSLATARVEWVSGVVVTQTFTIEIRESDR